MTSRRASRRDGHRQRPRRRTVSEHVQQFHDDDSEFWMQPAWCDLEGVDEAKDRIRTVVYEQLGDTRTGEAEWLVGASTTEGAEILSALQAVIPDMADAEANYFRRLRGHLREYGGTIVVAFVPHRPEGSA